MTETSQVEVAIDALLERLRAPAPDPVARMAEVEPLVVALSTAWRDADTQTPAGALAGKARALNVELATMKARLEVRGRVLARMRRAVNGAAGATYDRGAALVTASGHRMKRQAL